MSLTRYLLAKSANRSQISVLDDRIQTEILPKVQDKDHFDKQDMHR